MVNVTLTHGETSIEFANLPESSQRHLIERGFDSMINDKIAGAKAGIIGKGNNPWKDQKLAAVAEKFGLPNERTESNAQAICDAMQLDMFNAIVNGTTRDRSTRAPSLSGDDKLRRDIAIELLDKLAKDQGKILPKRSKPAEKAAFDELLAKAMSSTKIMDNGMTFPQSVEKEFTDRKKRATKIGSVDLDELLS